MFTHFANILYKKEKGLMVTLFIVAVTKLTVIFFIQKEKSMMHVLFCYHANVKRHAVLIFVSEWISPLCAVLNALVYIYV